MQLETINPTPPQHLCFHFRSNLVLASCWSRKENFVDCNNIIEPNKNVVLHADENINNSAFGRHMEIATLPQAFFILINDLLIKLWASGYGCDHIGYVHDKTLCKVYYICISTWQHHAYSLSNCIGSVSLSTEYIFSKFKASKYANVVGE